MTEDFKNQLISKHKDCKDFPTNEAIKGLFEDCLSLLFPVFSEEKLINLKLVEERLKSIRFRIESILKQYKSLCVKTPAEISHSFTCALENLENDLIRDVDAIYNGDPAAKSKEEVVRSYPGFYAISAYRLGNSLHKLGVKIVPRIITEIAHQRTGIDIHPAATIDHSFCIDHGTGIVIGETTTIGHNVKLYQGVTLGALSVDKIDADKKRHPTIEHHSVVYANATILGGKTTIGHHSIIGGNSWITRSVDPYSTVYYMPSNNQVEKKKKK
jgi:serine O-acetyltransferase